MYQYISNNLLLTVIWILSWRSSRLCKGKLMETRMDKESSRGIGMRLLAPRLNNRNLIFFGSPVISIGLGQGCCWKITLGRALQWDALAFLPHSTDTCWLQTITHTHTFTNIYALTSPPPIPRLRRFEPPAWQAGLWLAPGMAAGPDGCLPELDYFPCCKVVCLWCMCLLLRCFSCSHTVLPKEHSLGVVIFFLLTILMFCCIFLQFPVFLFCLPPCHIWMLCMDRLMANFTGTCD